MSDTEKKRRFLSYLGFAARSRNAAVGCELSLKAVRRSAGDGGTVAVLASDASGRTKKQMSDKCTYYKVFLAETDATADEIGAALGKKSPVASAAVTDKNLASAIIKLFEN